jgi:F0F1-type ATP synthase delta subunit
VEHSKAFVLPPSLVGPGDVSRLLREMTSLGDSLVTAEYRQEDDATRLKYSTPILSELASGNDYNLLDNTHRQLLGQQLENLSKNAPVIHISFVAEPSPKAVESIVVWVRANIHPYALLQVGLQPNIAAGAVVRTPNKIFDMSLRETIKQQQPYLLKLLRGVVE